jgi:hypothetical protein
VDRPGELSARRLRQTVAPTLPARFEAPITQNGGRLEQAVEVADAHGRKAALAPAGTH